MFFKSKPTSIPSAEQALPGRAAEMAVTENPRGYCGLQGTGVTCPISTGVAA
ncbi:MAG: hypothetical protein JWR51_2963 [Devosia sp.]|uniref:hypothetical protein n=1 Tax=Devosia sp. TaxID=1871048 RepID=UPI002623586A|nr:hypothetical protein [Devosia sp.]MDB5529860.1 hypothetical protein [Devosia sp.]